MEIFGRNRFAKILKTWMTGNTELYALLHDPEGVEPGQFA